MNECLFIIKPHAVTEGKVGNIVSRIEAKGLKIRDIIYTTLDEDMVCNLYSDHTEKTWFKYLLEMMTVGNVVIMVLSSDDYSVLGSSTRDEDEDDDLIYKVRTLVGSYDKPGTIRGDLGTSYRHNAVHASDSEEAAFDEIGWYEQVKALIQD